MRYLGGKVRIAQWVREVVAAHRGNCNLYLEPFVGGGGSFAKVAPDFPLRACGDAHLDLILMWQALADGWTPPESVTPEDYERLRNAPPSAFRGLVGFGASFGGNWFGSYVGKSWDKYNNRYTFDYYETARRAVMRDAAAFAGAVIEHGPYAQWRPGPGTLVYCDPPYAGTTGYTTGAFDHNAFWSTTAQWVDNGAVVLVSEESAPSGWVVAAERGRAALLNMKRAEGASAPNRTERIYRRAK